MTAFRIKGDGPPVFLQHGIADTADSFILRGEKSLPIRLAKAGYDVWLGNQRGTTHSKKHLFLNPDSKNAEER